MTNDEQKRRERDRQAQSNQPQATPTPPTAPVEGATVASPPAKASTLEMLNCVCLKKFYHTDETGHGQEYHPARQETIGDKKRKVRQFAADTIKISPEWFKLFKQRGQVCLAEDYDFVAHEPKTNSGGDA